MFGLAWLSRCVVLAVRESVKWFVRSDWGEELVLMVKTGGKDLGKDVLNKENDEMGGGRYTKVCKCRPV